MRVVKFTQHGSLRFDRCRVFEKQCCCRRLVDAYTFMLFSNIGYSKYSMSQLESSVHNLTHLASMREVGQRLTAPKDWYRSRDTDAAPPLSPHSIKYMTTDQSLEIS